MEGARGAQYSLHHVIRAYNLVQSYHALRACEDQSLRDWKKVRAKVNTSPQIETSCSERTEVVRAEGAGEGKKARRFATNEDGTGAPKRADLSLVSYLKAL